ncbi:MAG: XTP/dITP diphosphatase [candidate division Zixibacteria bacterium]|nr:XTP/dITP diphosphatase [candidate division Zixibacteria bacterium]
MQLVLATNNKDKVREIKEVLEGLDIEILTADDFDDFPEIEETGSTLEENAVLKAEGIFAFTGIPALADDSGLEVDYLNGAPGVFSSRYAGPGCTYDDNNSKLLKELAGVPKDKRTARFRCVIAVCFGDNDTQAVEGTAEGIIAETKSAARGGFGYDPVFYYPPLDKTFAELSLSEKNAVSHRGQALAKAKELLRQRLR